MAQKKIGKIGSSFDVFLAGEGILETCEEQALKEILADQIKAAMVKDGLTKSAMAARMQTSRRALDRLLDPKNPGAAHPATCRRRCWKKTPFGTGMSGPSGA